WCSAWSRRSPAAARRCPISCSPAAPSTSCSSTLPTSTSSASTSPSPVPAPPASSRRFQRTLLMSPEASPFPLAIPRPRPQLILAGSAALVVILVVSWVLLHQRERAATTAPAITVEGDTLHIAENAPQWRYVELSVAQQAPALPPPPLPGRVDFDEKRTASLSAPLAGRVEKVLVRVGDRVKEGDRLFNVRSAAWADLEKEMASARANVEVKKRIATRTRELVELRAAPEKDA